MNYPISVSLICVIIHLSTKVMVWWPLVPVLLIEVASTNKSFISVSSSGAVVFWSL